MPVQPYSRRSARMHCFQAHIGLRYSGNWGFQDSESLTASQGQARVSQANKRRATAAFAFRAPLTPPPADRPLKLIRWSQPCLVGSSSTKGSRPSVGDHSTILLRGAIVYQGPFIHSQWRSRHVGCGRSTSLQSLGYSYSFYHV